MVVGFEEGMGILGEIKIVSLDCDAGVRCLLRSMNMAARKNWLSTLAVSELYQIVPLPPLSIDKDDVLAWGPLIMGHNLNDPGLELSENHRQLSPGEMLSYLEKLRDEARRLYNHN